MSHVRFWGRLINSVLIARAAVLTIILGIFGRLYYNILPGSLTGYADSEELKLAIHHLTLAHPPGYPLFVVIFKFLLGILDFFVRIPYRYEVVNIYLTLLTGVALFYLAITLAQRLTKKEHERFLVAVVATVSWLSASSTVTHTITVEVFGLAQLMLFVAIWLWLKTLTYRGHIYLAMLGVVATLAGLHHPLAGIVSGLLLWERIFEYSRKKSWKKIGYIVSGMLLALVLTYRLYVWLGMREPGSFWWPISTNFEGIWRFFWRQDYAADGSAIERYTNSWSWPWALVSAREWMKRYIQDMGWSVILLILFAWIYVLKRFKKVFWLSLVVFLISGVGIAGYLLYPQASTATDSEFYWGSLLLYRMHYVAVVTGSLLSGLGVLWLKKFGRLVVVGASALLLLISLYRLQTAPLIGLTAREWYSLEILAMPRDSVVIVGNDLVFSLLYTQDVLGERKDLLVVPLRLFVRDKELVKRVQNPAVYDEVDYVARATHIVHWAQNSNRNVFLLGYDANMMDKLIFDGGPYTACPQGSLLEITRGPCSDTGIIYVADKSRVTNEWDKGFVGWLAETYAIQAYYAGRNGLAVEAQEYAAEAKSLAELNMTRQEIAATINFSYSTQIRNEIPVGELEQLAINAMSENSNEEAERMIRQALTIEPESKKLRQLWLKVARAQGYNALAQRLERYIALYN